MTLGHVQLDIATGPGAARLPPIFAAATTWLGFGHFAIALFIVLSGFCLSLPPLRRPDLSLSGGVKGYLSRRARRILPPYYAALALSLAFIAVVPGLREGIGSQWDSALPAFTPRAIVTHLLLVHNLHWPDMVRIDGPLWCVATEWQIYFLLPALLVLLRRGGIVLTVVAAWLLGEVLRHGFECACPQYIGLFGFGLAGAWVCVGPPATPARRAMPALGAALLAVWVLLVTQSGLSWVRQWMLDDLIGLSVTCFLVCLARPVATPADASLAVRLLGLRPVVHLGTFSYSLYLIHAPLLGAMRRGLQIGHVSPGLSAAALYLCGVPIMLAASYLFYLAWERPFLTRVTHGNVRQKESMETKSDAHDIAVGA